LDRENSLSAESILANTPTKNRGKYKYCIWILMDFSAKNLLSKESSARGRIPRSFWKNILIGTLQQGDWYLKVKKCCISIQWLDMGCRLEMHLRDAHLYTYIRNSLLYISSLQLNSLLQFCIQFNTLNS
jgi:hypothetical protein